MAEIPDLSGLFPQPGDPVDALRTAQIRAHSRVSRGSPLTVKERFEAFSSFGYHPHGLYRPDEPALAETITRTVKELGDIPARDERISKYLRLQDYCAELEAKGTPGHWDGMQAVARSTAKYRVVAQSRRVGKTYHATREALAVAIKRPRSHIWCCGPNWDAVGRVFDELIRLVEDLNLPIRRKRDQTDEKELILDDYESTFEGRSLKELPSIVGVSLTFEIVDEAAFVDKIMWDRGCQPPLTDQDGQALLLSNYFGDENWFTELAETAEADTGHRIWDIFKGTTWTNFYSYPQGRNTPSLKVVEETTDPLEFMEQYGGVPVSHVRRIYREYRDRVHALPTVAFDPNHAVILAVDPSAGAAPYAVAAIQDYGARTHIIDEYYQDGVITDDVIPVVQTRPWVGNVTDIILDSAAPDEAERWRRAGFTNAYGVLDKPDPVDRIPIIKRLLRDPALFRPFYVERAIHILRSKQDPRHPDELKDREEIQLIYEVEESFSDAFLTDEDIHILRECSHLFIAEHCHWTRYEFKRYAFVEPRSGTNRPERPRKAYDHLMDACLVPGTYVDMEHGIRQIRYINAGDLVKTRSGLRRVVQTRMTNPAAEVMRVHLSHGGDLTGTPDHRVWVMDRGWVTIGQLCVGDALWPGPNKSSGTVPVITDTLIPLTPHTEATSTLAKERSSTAMSGPRRMGQFREIITSITAMATRAITRWRTSSASTDAPMSRVTFGISPSMSGPVYSAVAPTSPRAVHEPSSAPGPVRPQTAALADWMMRTESASGVGPRSGSENIFEETIAPSPVVRVVALEALSDLSPVYDLTVDGAHEFFANGVLVHNCGYWAWDRKRFDVENFPRLPRPYGGGAQDQPDFRVLPGLPEMEIDLVGKPIDADTRARLYLARVRQETAPRKSAAHRYVTRKQ